MTEDITGKKDPRPWSIVRFKKNKYDAATIEKYFKGWADKRFIYFGEIPNSPNHCILWTIGTREQEYVGQPEFFRHVADFEEVPEDET